MRSLPGLTLVALVATPAGTQPSANPLAAEVDRLTSEMLPQVVAWRRDFHQHPELGNREHRTSKVIAKALEKLGYDVKTGVAHTGVVAVLKGAKPGPVVALRADMDALPVTEQVDVPFKSLERAMWNGEKVGVMHACGHDNHMAITLGAATQFARLQPQLPGTVKLIFQPAEEGPPAGEQGGAAMMVEHGVLDNPKVDAIFGLHVMPFRAGEIVYRSGPLMASGDGFAIRIKGRQTHGAVPWAGIDPIVIGSQIVMAAQTIISRNVDITRAPAVLTIGAFNGGNRVNIVPETVELLGTIRAFDETVRKDIQRRLQDIATKTAEAAGGSAEIRYTIGYPATINDAALTSRMVPTLIRVVGHANLRVGSLTGMAEDFSYYQQKVPGLFFFLGVIPSDQDPGSATQNHSPLSFADESALPVGVKALTNLALDYMFSMSK